MNTKLIQGVKSILENFQSVDENNTKITNRCEFLRIESKMNISPK